MVSFERPRETRFLAFWCSGWVAEWSKAAVLKTAVGESPPGVRIPPHPLSSFAAMSCVSKRVKLRPTRQRRVLPRNSLLRRVGAEGCRPADDGQRQDVSVVDGDAACSANATRRSGERFQGKNCWMSSGDFPPAAAQLSKYHVNHNRGLIFQCASVANSENIAAASRPLQRDPEP